MEMNDGVLIALTLGFLLGLKHATDADHVVDRPRQFPLPPLAAV